MKVVLIHRYFWPDTPPYAVMLRHIAGQLVRDGHDVTVLSTQPSYKSDFQVSQQPWEEEIDGFTLKRLKVIKEDRGNILKRIFAMFDFSIRLFFQLRREKAEIVSISTTPQIIGGVAVRLSCALYGGKYIYHCQDIHPEVAVVSGHLKKGFVYNLLRYLDRKTCDQAFATVVLSEDMRQSMLARGCNGDNIKVINNFELVPFEKMGVKNRPAVNDDIPDSLLRGLNKFRVIFAGNIGHFQGLEVVIEAAKLLENNKDIEFVFLGEGKAKLKLEGLAGNLLNSTVTFYGHQELDIARRIIADSQLGLVTLSKGVYQYAYPSKTMTYLCEGVPVIVVAEVDSELAMIVRHESLGITVAPGDAENLAKQIRDLYLDQKVVKRMQLSVEAYANNEFSLNNVLPRWSSLIKGGSV